MPYKVFMLSPGEFFDVTQGWTRRGCEPNNNSNNNELMMMMMMMINTTTYNARRVSEKAPTRANLRGLAASIFMKLMNSIDVSDDQL